MMARRQLYKICRLLLSLPVFCDTGAAAHVAASRKKAKYTGLADSYIFQPIALESHSTFRSSAFSFLTTFGEHLTGTFGDLRETSYLFQSKDSR